MRTIHASQAILADACQVATRQEVKEVEQAHQQNQDAGNESYVGSYRNAGSLYYHFTQRVGANIPIIAP